MDQILIALAGLMGTLGVVLTAAEAHGKPGTGLTELRAAIARLLDERA